MATTPFLTNQLVRRGAVRTSGRRRRGCRQLCYICANMIPQRMLVSLPFEGFPEVMKWRNTQADG
jgi:hypothetical protein